jgi:hypothetical protein
MPLYTFFYTILLNVLVQIANKMELQKKNYPVWSPIHPFLTPVVTCLSDCRWGLNWWRIYRTHLPATLEYVLQFPVTYTSVHSCVFTSHCSVAVSRLPTTDMPLALSSRSIPVPCLHDLDTRLPWSKLKSKSKSKLLYDWWSVSQYGLVLSTLVGLATRYYFLSECCCLKFAVLFLWGALSDERTGLQFAV